jgi:hypothetical protein
MDVLKVGESIRLEIPEGKPDAASWKVYPPLVTLAESRDGRDCTATGQEPGYATVRAIGAGGKLAEVFALRIDEDG